MTPLIPAESLLVFVRAQNNLMAYSTSQTNKCPAFAKQMETVCCLYCQRKSRWFPSIDGHDFLGDIEAVRSVPQWQRLAYPFLPNQWSPRTCFDKVFSSNWSILPHGKQVSVPNCLPNYQWEMNEKQAGDLFCLSFSTAVNDHNN